MLPTTTQGNVTLSKTFHSREMFNQQAKVITAQGKCHGDLTISNFISNGVSSIPMCHAKYSINISLSSHHAAPHVKKDALDRAKEAEKINSLLAVKDFDVASLPKSDMGEPSASAKSIQLKGSACVNYGVRELIDLENIVSLSRDQQVMNVESLVKGLKFDGKSSLDTANLGDSDTHKLHGEKGFVKAAILSFHEREFSQTLNHSSSTPIPPSRSSISPTNVTNSTSILKDDISINQPSTKASNEASMQPPTSISKSQDH
ncbi:hypothetical protein REPUB_Repub03eG0125600 [Reevesia pubescens]